MGFLWVFSNLRAKKARSKFSSDGEKKATKNLYRVSRKERFLILIGGKDAIKNVYGIRIDVFLHF